MSTTEAHETPPQQHAVGARLERGVRPCAWRWLDTAVFRKKLPKTAEAGAWGPLYDQAALGAEVAAERERLAARFDDSDTMIYRSEVAAAIRRA